MRIKKIFIIIKERKNETNNKKCNKRNRMCNDWNINCSSITYVINNNNKYTLLSTNRIQMIYKLTPKKSRDVKTLIDAKTKRAAISYFAALLHLNKEDLLEIFSIR